MAHLGFSSQFFICSYVYEYLTMLPKILQQNQIKPTYPRIQRAEDFHLKKLSLINKFYRLNFLGYLSWRTTSRICSSDRWRSSW